MLDQYGRPIYYSDDYNFEDYKIYFNVFFLLIVDKFIKKIISSQ